MRRLTDEQRALAESFVRAARAFAGRYSKRTGAPYDDVLSAALLAVCVASTERPKAGYTRRQWVAGRIRFGTLSALYEHDGRPGRVKRAFRAAAVPLREGDAFAPDAIREVDDRDEVAALLARLSPRLRRVAERYVMAGESSADLAAEWGRSESSVRMDWRAALPVLRGAT